MLSSVVKKILIVEDNENISTLYRIKFEKEWYVVRVCGDGMDAITHVMDFTPDAILLDIMMPSMNGFEALRVIRQLVPSLRTKIVMFSNLNSQNDIDRCIQAGADWYMLKADTTPAAAVQKIEELFAYSQMKGRTDLLQVESHTKTNTMYCKCPSCWEEFEQTLPM